MYRLNYGNGQASDSFNTLAAAKKALKDQVDFDGYDSGLFIEKKMDGEWFPVKDTCNA